MCAFATTTVDPTMYRPWFHLVTLSFVIPIPFLAVDLWLQRPEWFAPSGSMTLFLVAVVQFKQLGFLQNKHITNANRASKGEPVQLLSEEYRRLELRSFWAALFGTGIWAYGDKIVRLLLCTTQA